MSLVSIVVPVYNAEKYLSRCLDSILAQTHENIEVLLIDDGSKDESGRICDGYAQKDGRVRVWHTQNGGVAKARNVGIENARGDWLTFVDADDWLEKEGVEKMLEFTLAQEADLGIFSLKFIYSSSTSDLQIFPFVGTPKQLFERHGDTNVLTPLICSPCTKLYKRSLVQDGGIRFLPGVPFGEDFIFNSYYLRVCTKLASQNTGYYNYDCTPQESGVKKVYPAYDEYIGAMDETFEKTLQVLDVEGKDEVRISFIAERWAYAFYVCLQSAKGVKEKASYMEKWLAVMPKAYYPLLQNQGGEVGALFTALQKKKGLLPTLRKLRRIQRRKAIWIKLKRALRGKR